ncbi:MAG TPA: methyltransferase domain-containing protein [Nitrososphaerales archaeon]|nr:methyltransferase domain-containing protein [Nitrososphaerales archaeon]
MAHSGTESDWEAFIATLDPKSGDRILDVGAGKGEKAARLSQAFPGTEVFAVDPNERRITEAKRDHPNIRSTVAGAEKLPFDDASFDKAYSTMALHHFADLDKAVGEICRVVRPGGSYVILEVEPGSPLGKLFRFFGRLLGEKTQIMTEEQLMARLGRAAGFHVARSVNLGSRYLVQLTRT